MGASGCVFAWRLGIMAQATLSISSKNYSSWSLRGWLLARFAGLEFKEVVVSPDDADARRELLRRSWCPA